MKKPSAGDKEQKKREKKYFLRLFEKYDFRDEQQFVTFWKVFSVCVLVVLEVFILLQHVDQFEERGGWRTLGLILGVSALLLLVQALKHFAVQNTRAKKVFFVFDMVLAGLFIFLTSGSYTLIVYMLITTEYYLTAKRTRGSVVLFCIAAPLYGAFEVMQAYLSFGGTTTEVNLFPLLTGSIGSVFALLLHFVIVQVALAFYRQFLRLEKTLKELDESKKELEKAYEVVAEVSALEERQRIAKDIHDTAGHSITTVIMQTESAKLLIDKSPEEAKNKIVAANLQAKHALEELRDSVHLLSGGKESVTLKTALENIVHESTDGTGITIRSEIEDAEVSPAKFRFICNTLKEGISNGLRHGGATAFWFEFKREGETLRFLLSDNGKGCKLEELKTGFGLTSMIDHAKSLGGEVKFHTEEGEGFEITLTLPVDYKEDEDGKKN
ncbi:MAG: sensor histidine kinase [Clostridia bacterium]|nr:sensor histidine kinase [Clostridia bacterium]